MPFQVERDDIAAGRLLSRSHHHNVMSCHIKILQLVNLERHQYCAAARLIAAITITLKVRGDKCQQEHWLEERAQALSERARSSRTVPGGAARCQDLVAAFSLPRAPEWLRVPPHRALSITKGCGEET